MDTHKLEDGSRLLGTVRWGAIATGAFVAVALQTVLMLFGFAIATSTGDHSTGTGYALWALLSQVCALAVGSALAASVGHAETRGAGMAAGAMTWAVALVLGSIVTGFGHLNEAAAWTAFFGAVLGLGAAMLGGAFAAKTQRFAEPAHYAG